MAENSSAEGRCLDAAIDARIAASVHPDEERQLGERIKRLYANGWTDILPCVDKRPLVPGWRHRPVHELLVEASEDATNIGHRTGALVGVDVDLEDAAHTEAVQSAIEARLGRGLVRVGRRGAMLLYYNLEPIEKVSITAKAVGSPKPAKLVEFMGVGQQIIIDGIHPDTGQPYRFDGPSPFDTQLWELPAVTPNDIRAAAEDVAGNLTELGYEDVHVGHASRAADVQFSTGEPVTLPMLRDMLACINPEHPQLPKSPRDGWIDILTALKRAFVVLPDGETPDPDFDPEELAVEWSAGLLRAA